MNKYLYLLALLSTIIASGNAMAQTTDKKIYIIPHEAKCIVRKADKVTYCVEKRTGEPINGELHRYYNNNLKSIYPLTNGILEGTALVYYDNGKVRTEKPYTAGKLNGTAKKYDNDGHLISETPYENGLEEGVAKYYNPDGSLIAQAIYQSGKPNGEMRVYTNDNTVLYSFINQDGLFVAGNYQYLSENNQLTIEEIPTVILNAFNNKCLDMQTELTHSACAAVLNIDTMTNSCNQEWRKKNRKAVRQYLANCQKEEIEDEQQ